MTKFLTMLTSAILALLLIAIGFFLVRDGPAPVPAAVDPAADPAYEAAIAPPESLTSAPVQGIGGLFESEKQAVVTAAGDEAVSSSGDESQPIVHVSRQQGAGEEGEPELPSSSAAPDAGREAAEGKVQESVSASSEVAASPNTPNVADRGDPAGASTPGTDRAVGQEAAGVEAIPQDQPVNDGDGARRSAGESSRTYIVRSGDNLSSIAKRFYRNPTLWRHIRDANRDILGNGVKQIAIGTRLTIPPLKER